MASLASSQQMLHLYRNMLRASRGFAEHDFRAYAFRRIRSGFVENRGVTDPVKQSELIERAQRDYELIQRQSLISRMFGKGNFFIERPEARAFK